MYLQIFVERLPLFHPDAVVGYPALLQVGVDDAHLEAVLFCEKGSLFWYIVGNIVRVHAEGTGATAARMDGSQDTM